MPEWGPAYVRATAVDPEFWVLSYRRRLLLQAPLGRYGDGGVDLAAMRR